jgi:hypothetical protein
MYLRLVLHVGKRARTIMENVIPLGFKMFQMPMWMTYSLRSMSIMPSPLTRNKQWGVSASSVAVLGKVALDLATTMTRTMGEQLLSSHLPVP